MKYYVLGAFFILATLTAGFFWWRSSYDATTERAKAHYTYTYPDFVWGTGINVTPTGISSRESVLRVVEEAQALGINTIRVRYTHEYPEAIVKIDWLAEILRERQPPVQVILIFDQNPDVERIAEPNAYQTAFLLAKNVATKYRDVFQYYQLGNEMAAYALKPTWGGYTTDSYIPEKYQEALLWLRGLSDGVAAGDPQAKRVVTGNWLNVVFWEQAKHDGLQFEIVGWDWFYEKFPIPDPTKLTVDGKPYDLIGKLAALGDVWMTEAGVNGDIVGDREASDYLEQLVRQLYRNPLIKGFFLPMLTDEMHRSQTPNWQYAPVELIYENNQWQLGGHRIIFDRYHQLIQEAQSGSLAKPTAITLPNFP